MRVGKRYSFGRIPRANKGDGTVNVRDEVGLALVVLHLEGNIELLATGMVLSLLPTMRTPLRVLRSTCSHSVDCGLPPLSLGENLFNL